MSDRMLYWIDLDFGRDHIIVKSDRNPSFSSEYDDRYFSGPYPTLTEAKERIRSATRVQRVALSDKLSYWMERTVSDIPIVDALTEE